MGAWVIEWMPLKGIWEPRDSQHPFSMEQTALFHHTLPPFSCASSQTQKQNGGSQAWITTSGAINQNKPGLCWVICSGVSFHGDGTCKQRKLVAKVGSLLFLCLIIQLRSLWDWFAGRVWNRLERWAWENLKCYKENLRSISAGAFESQNTVEDVEMKGQAHVVSHVS